MLSSLKISFMIKLLALHWSNRPGQGRCQNGQSRDTGTVGEQEEELARRYPVTVLAKPVNIRLIMASVERLLEG